MIYWINDDFDGDTDIKDDAAADYDDDDYDSSDYDVFEVHVGVGEDSNSGDAIQCSS